MTSPNALNAMVYEVRLPSSAAAAPQPSIFYFFNVQGPTHTTTIAPSGVAWYGPVVAAGVWSLPSRRYW